MADKKWTPQWCAFAKNLRAQGFTYSGIGEAMRAAGFTGAVNKAAIGVAFQHYVYDSADEAGDEADIPADPQPLLHYGEALAATGCFSGHPLAAAPLVSVRRRLMQASPRLAYVLRRELQDRKPLPPAFYPNPADLCVAASVARTAADSVAHLNAAPIRRQSHGAA